MSVVLMPGSGKRSPEAVLEIAREAGFDDVIILGRNADELTIASSHTDSSVVLWELMQAQRAILGE